MKKTVLVAFIFCAISFVEAQTKLISHKSHSGKSKSFHKAMNKFGIVSSNFGIPSFKPKVQKIDPLNSSNSYGSKRDNSNSVKTCEFCTLEISKHSDYDTITFVSNDCILRKKSYKGSKELLFVDKNSKLFKLLINLSDLEGLRINNDLKGECFHNTVFVGFEKRIKEPLIEKDDSEKQSIPLVIKNTIEPHFNYKYWILGLIVLVSIFTALIYKKQIQKA